MPHSNIHSKTREQARALRRNMTEPERRLWRRLRELKPLGLHFRRQVPIGPYIADFALLTRKIVVELDGDTHGTSKAIAHDAERTAWFVDQGFRELRFSNSDVMSTADIVTQSILDHVQTDTFLRQTGNPS